MFSGHCPITPKVCAIDDLPAEQGFNITNVTHFVVFVIRIWFKKTRVFSHYRIVRAHQGLNVEELNPIHTIVKALISQGSNFEK